MKSAIQHTRRTIPVNGLEAMAIVALLQHAEMLQVNLKAAIKEDADWYSRFMPLSAVVNDGPRFRVLIIRFSLLIILCFYDHSFLCILFQIMEFVPNRSLVRLIEQVIDENGSVKDSAVCYRSYTSFLFFFFF